MSDALYDGPNRVIIDDNTPETNSLPISGGKGVDEFLITLTANSVVIEDDSEANVIVFERDVVITSIERQAGSEGASVAQYVITLSSGKTITLRNPASFTFQHLDDATRTAPISAEDFITAYEDGFAASDASHPDIIGDASGPSGVQGPIFTGTADDVIRFVNFTELFTTGIDTNTDTGEVTEDDAIPLADGHFFNIGTQTDLIVTLQGGNGVSLRPDGSGYTQYGNMTFSTLPGHLRYGNDAFAFNETRWYYLLDSSNTATQRLADGQTVNEVFTFVAGTATYEVIITIDGRNDAPYVATAIKPQRGAAGQEKVIDLSTLFSDIDTGDTLTLSVVVELGRNEITFDGSRNIISDPNASKMLRITLASIGTYTVTVMADDGKSKPVSSSFYLVVGADTPPAIGIPGSADRFGAGAVTEDGTLTATGELEVTDVDNPPTLPAIELDGDGVGTYGTMTFDESSGEWTYTLAVTPEQGGETQALTEGQTETETFTFTALGADNFAVEITVTGANDAPVVATAIEPQSGLESQEKVIDLSTLFSDIDTNDTLTLSVAVELDGTEITFDGSRNIISDPNASKMLRITLASAGTHTVTVVADDGNGGRVSSSFSLEVEADIAPVIGIPGSEDRTGVGAVTEDGTLTATGMLEVTDADSPPTLPTIELDGDGVGTYGTMTFDESSGEWTYTLDERAEALGDQQTATETFTFSAGRASFEVTITITGANDAPVVATAIEPQSGVEGQEKVIDLSTLFTDVDEGDELTFTVTLDDGAALSTIGLTYDSDEDEITGTLTGTGTYVIKIVATDKSGATFETTFDLNILSTIPMIQRSSLTYNPDETSITIDETMLEVISNNQLDPTLLVYTITTLPDAGVLSKSGTQLNNGDTFTQADINNGLITYVPSVSGPSTSQSNPMSFTFSDGVETLEEKQTLQITSRKVVGNTASAQDNTADFSDVDVPQKIEAGDGSDIITGGAGNDQIDGGAGDDEIILTRDDNGEQVDAGADEVLYTFGYDGVGIDGGDEIVGFKRGQDKLTFVVNRNFNNLTAFLQSLKGADDEDLTADDAFVVTMQWGTDEDGDFYFDGVLLHFKDASAFGGGRVSSPLVTVTFDERLDFDGLVEILGGTDKVAANFDFTHAAFKNLDEVLPPLFGESSIDFVVLPFSNSISVPDDATPPSQNLIGDDNIQTLNYGASGNLIFGGRGDDIINLGDGRDDVYYRYDGVDDSDSAAFDGGDVINNFDLDEDLLFLNHAEGNIDLMYNDDDIATFFDAIKGVSLLDSGGKITGIVFTFIDRAEGADDDAEIDLTVNLENDDFISSEDIDLTAFNEVEIGKWTIKTDQETAAYETIIDDVLRSALRLSPFFIVSGYGVNGVTIGDEATTSRQYLLGGDNVQTLNAGTGGDDIVGGKGDDIINLGGGWDSIFYHYDGADKTDSAAYDGSDVINNFDLDEDALILRHVGNNVHSSTAEFYAAIKGVSLLVGVINEDEVITGIVFTFTDRDTPTEEIDLTVNFETADFIFPEITALTAFNEEVSGRRTIKTGQEIAAYQVIDAVLDNNLYLYNFARHKPPPPSQNLIGDDNIQTLNYGAAGNLIFGGRGDDIINLGDGRDDVYYRYDGVDDSDSAAFDGGDVINNFDLDEDELILLHVGNNVHDDLATFFDAIKGVSLLDSGGKITGIVFTFIDRAEGANDDDEIDLTVNLENDDFISSEDIDLTAFNEEVSGRRTIKTGQEDAAYEIITDDIFSSFSLRLSPFFIVSGYGVNGVTIGDEAPTSRQYLLGGDNVQTLNAGTGGDDIVGGKGDDIINLGGGWDSIFYHYDGADKTDSAAYDGSDVINNFDLDEDALILRHVGNNVHSSTAEFYAAIKGVSLLVGVGNRILLVEENKILYEDEVITGIVFTFTDRDTPTEEIDLTVNFENADFIFSEDIDLTAFNEEVSGRRTIKTNQEDAAYEVIDAVLDNNLYLYNFARHKPPPPSQNLIGDDNIQTLNYGAAGNLIFGGRGDDIINLGDGRDDVYYRYDGVYKTDSAAFDGGDVINNFDLDEDILLLFHAEGRLRDDDDITTFFYAIKGVSLLESRGKITGIVFTFIDRAEGADDDDEIDLTVNLENDDFISSEDIDLTAFNEEVSGRRTIKTGQETAAYQTITNDLFPYSLYLSSNFIVSGYGVNGVTIGDKAATSGQYLIGGNNAQTLNAGPEGDDIVGGKDDDIINLGDGIDYIYYGYDGADKTDSAAYDGGDVINNFDLDRDQLRLQHVGNNVHSSTAEFYAAIKGVSLLVDVIYGDEAITGIVFTFTDRDTPTEEIDLTVNFENADFIFPEITALTAFNEEVSGRRTIKTGQEIAAYQVIDAVLDNNLYLYNFARHKPLPPSQIPIGYDNIQTLNLGAGQTLFFDGRGDDIINLGSGTDFVYYRYDGVDDSDSAAFDGGDVINNFDLDKDLLAIYHAEGNINYDITMFFDAIKGVSLLESRGKITGIVFTFIDRAEGADDDDEIDLTVNFARDDFIFTWRIDLTAFNEKESGRRTIKTGQEDAAYEIITDDIFSSFSLHQYPELLVFGYGIDGVTIGNKAATSDQFLIGGDNAQTLNAGALSDRILGGKGDDIINLKIGEDSLADYIFYHYEGADKTDSVAIDGGDVINNFDLDKDSLRLHNVGKATHSSFIEFYASIKGVSLLVGVNNGDENITGIVFTFTDRDIPTEEIDLTVNFETADFIFPEITVLTAFNEEVSGRRTIKTNQEDAAYEVINAILGDNLTLSNIESYTFVDGIQ